MPRTTGWCLFGGAFDPPHLTHRRLAAAAGERLGVDRVLVLPTGAHPHKGGASLAPAEHRLALCRLAFAGVPRVVVDDREIRRGGASYTIDTVRDVRRELGAGPPIHVLIGSDNLPSLPSWREHHALLAEASVVTFPRAGHPCTADALRGLDLRQDEVAGLIARCLPLPEDAVSATAIRKALARGERPTDLLPAVADYIAAHGLYR